MGNIAYGKNAVASSYVKPFSPQRAVDGSNAPVNRWLCNQLPGYMTVDFGGIYWISRWVVTHMQASCWSNNIYNTQSYNLQGSINGANWFDIDSVSNNTSYQTDRSFAPIQCRFARLKVTTGLRINPQIAGIVEFQVYEATPSSPYLSNLTLSSGILSPTFNNTIASYSANVEYDTQLITVTPTAQDPQAEIKVNGTIVMSGSASQPIPLSAGQVTPIDVQVTSKIGGIVQHYTVNVTRASSPYLQSVTGFLADLSPTFSNTNLGPYAVSTTATSLKIIATSEDSNATITVNGTAVVSGGIAKVIMTQGQNQILIVVTSKIGTDNKTYTFNVIKQ